MQNGTQYFPTGEIMHTVCNSLARKLLYITFDVLLGETIYLQIKLS